jgi:hypothetical protein
MFDFHRCGESAATTAQKTKKMIQRITIDFQDVLYMKDIVRDLLFTLLGKKLPVLREAVVLIRNMAKRLT